MLNYILSKTNCTFFLNNQVYSVKKDEKIWDQLIEAIKTENIETIQNIVDQKTAIINYIDGSPFCIKNNTVYYNDKILDNSLTQRIIEMHKDGFNIAPMARFVHNLMQNPSNRAIQELYNFLEVCNLPITEDGRFIAYKRIRYDYKDCHSGTIDNTPGVIVRMPRNQVDDNKENTCSHGLHVCSLAYLAHFCGDRLIVVLVNPRDVVSIPIDYNNSKMRVCEYESYSEIPMETLNEFNNSLKSVFQTTNSFEDNNDDDDDEFVEDYDDDELFEEVKNNKT